MFVSQLALGLHGRIMARARQHVESVLLRERANVKAAQAVLATLRKQQDVQPKYVHQVSRVCCLWGRGRYVGVGVSVLLCVCESECVYICVCVCIWVCVYVYFCICLCVCVCVRYNYCYYYYYYYYFYYYYIGCYIAKWDRTYGLRIARRTLSTLYHAFFKPCLNGEIITLLEICCTMYIGLLKLAFYNAT